MPVLGMPALGRSVLGMPARGVGCEADVVPKRFLETTALATQDTARWELVSSQFFEHRRLQRGRPLTFLC
jgi:hypothetical protein